MDRHRQRYRPGAQSARCGALSPRPARLVPRRQPRNLRFHQTPLERIPRRADRRRVAVFPPELRSEKENSVLSSRRPCGEETMGRIILAGIAGGIAMFAMMSIAHMSLVAQVGFS